MAEALDGIADGSTVLIGGFGSVGQPDALIEGLIEQGARDLVCVANNAGGGRAGLARLMELGRVRRIVCSFPRTSDSVVFQELYQAGRIELELVPQGTLAERLRAAGAGIPAFFTATSAGTALARGKEQREFGGRIYVMEHALHADVALVEAWEADRWGNLTYRASGRNFNPVMAMAARLTVVQTQHVAELGAIDPQCVVTPGIFVDRVLHVPYLEFLRFRRSSMPLTRTEMAEAVARDIPEGWYVNLGIGIPTLVADHVPAEREVIFHSENGVLGIGPAPAPDAVDPWLINAGKQHVTLRRRRILLPPRRQLRDDPRRPSRSVRAGRVRGGGERRHRELGDERERYRASGGRGDGPRRRRPPGLGGDGAHDPGRAAAPGAALLLSADSAGFGQPGLYQPCGARRRRGRVCGARAGAGRRARRAAGADGCAFADAGIDA